MKHLTAILTITLLVLTFNAVSFASDYYVDAVNGDNAKTGTSADSAWKTISYAISNVSGTLENPAIIHVAAGTYNMALGEVFPLNVKNNMMLLGADRDMTILDGTGSDKSVVFFDLTTYNAIEGFTITGGEGILFVNGDLSFLCGGGIFCSQSSPLITNCKVTGNKADLGAGICCIGYASPTILNCEIRENTAYWDGGGISCSSYSSPIVSDCIINGNAAEQNTLTGGRGGGFYCEWYSSPEINNCKISDNEAAGKGGGINFNNNYSNIRNSIFYRNKASGGGGLYFRESEPVLTNCLIVENTADTASGVYNYSSSTIKINNSTIVKNSSPSECISNFKNSKAILTNCIVFENEQYPLDLYATVTYSTIQYGHEGEGNINQDPMFVVGSWGDYYLSQKAAGQDADSPCINTGSEIPIMGFNPSDYITRTDGVGDMGVVDMGYHYPRHVRFGLSVDVGAQRAVPLDIASYVPTSDTVTLRLDVVTAPVEITADIYFIMLDPDGSFYSGMAWSKGLQPLVTGFRLPANLDIESSPLFNFTIPGTMPPVSKAGTYTFYLGAVKPGTADFISNIAVTSFNVQ